MAEIKEVLYQKIRETNNTQIALSLNMSRNTVRNYLKIAKKHGFKDDMTNEELDRLSLIVQKEIYGNKGGSKAFDKIKPLHEQIALWLKEKYITHTQINRKLKELDIIVSERTLNRYIKEYFPTLPKATIHLVTKPGEEAQVDYGYVGFMQDKDGKNRKTYAFVMTLSHSRHRYVEFVFSQDHVSWAQSHINAFAFFGVVPKRILLDNLKSGVIEPNIYDPTLNRTYQELAVFYNFVADPAKVRKPEHKGKVEKSVHIVKQQLIAACHYVNIDEANKAAHQWCSEQISQIVCQTTGHKPIDLFEQEDKPAMLSLPKGNFDMPAWTQGSVHHDHHIMVRGSFYSLPTAYIKKEVSIRIGIKTVRFYYKNELIKTHLLSKQKGQWMTDNNDYHKSAKYYLDQLPSGCMEQAYKIGEATHQMIMTVLENGSRTSLRKAQGIIRLSESYPPERLEAACLRSITFDNYRYDSIKKILKEGLDKKGTQTFSVKVVDPEESAYIRPSNSYSSSMEANYG